MPRAHPNDEESDQGLANLEVVRPISSVTDADVEEMIEKLRAQKQTLQIVERSAQDKDNITISFSGVSEGENFTDGQVDDFGVVLGSKKMIPGFEDNLVGLSTGDNKTFTVTFPEDYGNEKLAGKEAEFQITVTKVEEPVLAEINEEFVKAYGVEDGSVESFRNDVKNNMDRELEQALRGKLKNAVMDAVYENVKISLPNSLVDVEVEEMMKPYLETAKRQKMQLEDLKLPRELFEEQAKRRVALGLILGEIIQKKAIQLDVNKVRSTIEDMAKSYERPDDVVAWYYADKTRLNDVQQMVLEDQVVEVLISEAKVSDNAVKFSDVMDKQQR